MYIKWLQIGNNHFEFKKRSVSLRNVLKSVFSKKVSAAVLTAVMLFVSVFSMSMIASAASFSPRLSAPSSSNKYYYSNLNVFYKYGYGMPNCTAYAYGRAYEILGSEPKLSWNNAEQWYGYNKSNGYYKYGQTPKVGAIACWSYNGAASTVRPGWCLQPFPAWFPPFRREQGSRPCSHSLPPGVPPACLPIRTRTVSDRFPP